MASRHLVLLPGLDGTGELFGDFVAALPETYTATIVAYPTDRFLSYTDLRPLVSAVVPQSKRFVLVAESVSFSWSDAHRLRIDPGTNLTSCSTTNLAHGQPTEFLADTPLELTTNCRDAGRAPGVASN